MQIGDLVTVEKKVGIVDEGIIVGIENSGNCFKAFEVLCFGTGKVCSAHPLDVKKMTGEKK
jgi:hypothetical protein